jgi:hypothetical protein
MMEEHPNIKKKVQMVGEVVYHLFRYRDDIALEEWDLLTSFARGIVFYHNVDSERVDVIHVLPKFFGVSELHGSLDQFLQDGDISADTKVKVVDKLDGSCVYFFKPPDSPPVVFTLGSFDSEQANTVRQILSGRHLRTCTTYMFELLSDQHPGGLADEQLYGGKCVLLQCIDALGQRVDDLSPYAKELELPVVPTCHITISEMREYVEGFSNVDFILGSLGKNGKNFLTMREGVIFELDSRMYKYKSTAWVETGTMKKYLNGTPPLFPTITRIGDSSWPCKWSDPVARREEYAKLLRDRFPTNDEFTRLWQCYYDHLVTLRQQESDRIAQQKFERFVNTCTTHSILELRASETKTYGRLFKKQMEFVKNLLNGRAVRVVADLTAVDFA